MKTKYYSQSGQDKYIAKLIKYKRDGFFLDVGAYDGINLSNTYFFEQSLDWKGICIEPNPEIFEKLSKNRKCTSVNCCIAAESGVLKYLSISGYGEMLSGIVSLFDERSLQRIDQTIETHGGSKKIIEIAAFPLKELLKNHNVNYIDYCNIDVEGGEMSVLSSIDFSQVQIKFLSVENNYGTKIIRNYLKPKGYSLIGKLGADEIYEFQSKRYLSMFLFKFKPLMHFLSAKKNRFLKAFK